MGTLCSLERVEAVVERAAAASEGGDLDWTRGWVRTGKVADSAGLSPPPGPERLGCLEPYTHEA